jgi:hypothetical protein
MVKAITIIPETKKARLPSRVLPKMRVLPYPLPTMPAAASHMIRT